MVKRISYPVEASFICSKSLDCESAAHLVGVLARLRKVAMPSLVLSPSPCMSTLESKLQR